MIKKNIRSLKTQASNQTVYSIIKGKEPIFAMPLKLNLIIKAVFFAVFFLALPHTSAAALIAHWKFDEGTGTTPADSSGNNITGTFTATQPTWSTDVPSVSFSNPYSLDFSSTGDAVYFSWPSSLNFTGTANRSFSFWYKPTGDGENASGRYDRIMSWTDDKFEIAGTLGDVTVHRLAFYDGSWRDTGFNLTPGSWHHITFTYDGTNVKLYVDNVVKFSGTSEGRDINGTMYIGLRYTGDEGINGRIDDFRIYDVALTTSQIENLYEGSSNPDEAPDSTAPTISALSATASSSTASISWTTNEAASTRVVYSANTTYASSTITTNTSTRVTSHTANLSGLRSCTMYNYKAVSADAANNTATSSASSFTTAGCTGGTPSAATSSVVSATTSNTTTLTDTGRSLSATTPANFTATSSSVIIQIKALSSTNVISAINKPSNSLSSAASIAFDVTALINNTTVLDSFNSPVTLAYTYTDADVSGLDETSLKMYHYHNSTWTQLTDCSVSTALNKITCTTSSFSIFAIFGTAAASNSSSGGGGLPPAAYHKPAVPAGGFVINAIQKSVGHFTINSNAGPDTKHIAISTSPDFTNVGLLPYSASLSWSACTPHNPCPQHITKLYVKFYTGWGQQSEVLTAQVNTGAKTAASTTCSPYLNSFIQFGRRNNVNEVKKLQQFLNTHENEKLKVDGTYKAADVAAVKRFQSKYSSVLSYWGLTKPTGFVFTQTRAAINRIHCQLN